MKKIVFAIFIALAVFNFTGCGTKNNTEKFEVEIPSALEDKPEVVKFIKGTNEVVNEYTVLIEKIFDEAGEFAGKKTEDLGMIDQLKLIKLTGEVSLNSIEIMTKWGEFIEKRSEINTQLSDEEVKSLDSIWKQFEQRMKNIEEKYNKAFDKKDDN
ncbi:MAG: hypothetical protein JEY94_08540 [Melioribacteraceae bacterium]|nr:hypothetical protein [Melioribacteraceae bacterium]